MRFELSRCINHNTHICKAIHLCLPSQIFSNINPWQQNWQILQFKFEIEFKFNFMFPEHLAVELTSNMCSSLDLLASLRIFNVIQGYTDYRIASAPWLMQPQNIFLWHHPFLLNLNARTQSWKGRFWMKKAKSKEFFKGYSLKLWQTYRADKTKQETRSGVAENTSKGLQSCTDSIYTTSTMYFTDLEKMI